MRSLLKYRVPVAWLLLVMIVVAAVGILWKVAVLDAPPPNSVLIEESAPLSAAQQGGTEETTGAATPTDSMATNNTADGADGAATPSPELIAVYVSGQIANPGVYTLIAGSRVADAISAAGGPLPEANLEAINLARRLSDEEHVSVPRIGETPAPVPSPRPGASQAPQTTPQPRSGAKVNINTASQTELEELPGIGPALAARIVEYRAANGPFKTIDGLKEVPGIGESIFGQIADLITVGP